jgi:precorrin-2 dehydrogenase/sirohydrochlorin ferrochelatase
VAEGYPIVLDLTNRLVVVIGGGAVALRKVQGLIASGASRIRIVSPSFHAEMPAESSVIQRVVGAYRPEHLDGASLVFAATDSPEVNDAIVRDSNKMGALVCRADVDEDNAGDFATPAMIREGSLLITVSSGGSPALSALIRDRIKGAIDPRWSMMADAMQQLRPMLRKSLAPARRKQAFRDLCSEEAFNALSTGGIEQLLQWLRVKHPEFDKIQTGDDKHEELAKE